MSPSPNDSSAGPVAWVLGAGRDPARTLALSLAQRGFRLALYDLNPAALEATADQVRSLAPAEPFPLQGDPVRKIALQALLNRIEDHWGRLDLIVYGLEANPGADLRSLDEWDWHRALDINLTVPWLLAQMAARVMRGGLLAYLGGDEPLHPPRDEAGLPLRAGRGGLLAALPQWAEMLAPARVRAHLLLPARPYDPLWRAVVRPSRAVWLREPPLTLPDLLLRLWDEPLTGLVLYPGK